MDEKTFSTYRRRLGKTQKVMAQLLGTSLKAVHSYEQGWRHIPPHVQRQVYFLLARQNGRDAAKEPCWEQKGCPEERRSKCPAWEFDSGDLCWFVNGTICQGEPHSSWKEKIVHCLRCPVLTDQINA